MTNHNVPELDKLFEEVGTYKKSAEYGELLSFVKRFRHIAPYNAMLLHIQNPDCTYVASAYDWQSKFGRSPVKGARPYLILRPFGPVAFLYDIKDTEGDAFPERLLEPFKACGNMSDSKLESFIKSAYYDGFIYREEKCRNTLAGYIKTVDYEDTVRVGKKKKDFKLLFEITINEAFDNTTKLVTLFHEMGHAYCGHLYQPLAKWIPQRYYLDLDCREFEAESVCWILCERMGIDNPSAAYLNGYLNSNNQIPDISIDSVLKAVTSIDRILEGISSPKKELLVDNADSRQMSLFSLASDSDELDEKWDNNYLKIKS